MKVRDIAQHTDRAGIVKGMSLGEFLAYKTKWAIHKWEFPESVREEAEAMLKAGASIAKVKAKYGPSVYLGKFAIDGNLLLNEGINALWTLVAGGAETAYNNANAEIGVGDSATAEAASQTDLQAASNKLFVAMDATYPTYGTSQKITFRSTFTGAQANFAWAEFSVRNGNSANKNLNRKVSAQGTKTSGQSWQVTIDITLS